MLPRVLRAVFGAPLTVPGLAHPTPDGSAIRDFVHVRDVAAAHVAAVRRLTSTARGSAVYNVGTGHGCSVLELIALTERVTGRPVQWTGGPARPGDPSRSVADPSLIARELGWRARWDLSDALASAWAARAAWASPDSPADGLAVRGRSRQPAAAG